MPQSTPASGFVSNNFGVGLVGTSSGNLVEKNKIGGNFNGVYIGPGTKGGNVIRRNIIVGNPPVQISSEFGASVGADIQDQSKPTLGTNISEDNRCLTYAGQTVPPPCPQLSNSNNDEDRREDEDQREEEMSANRRVTPFKSVWQTANFARNRLIFPQARLVNAVFQPSDRLPRAAGKDLGLSTPHANDNAPSTSS